MVEVKGSNPFACSNKMFLGVMVSTTDFGSVSGGSSPSGTTILKKSATLHYFCPGGTVLDCAGFVNRNYREFESHPGLNRLHTRVSVLAYIQSLKP